MALYATVWYDTVKCHRLYVVDVSRHSTYRIKTAFSHGHHFVDCLFFLATVLGRCRSSQGRLHRTDHVASPLLGQLRTSHGQRSFPMYCVHVCATHITPASRWSPIHFASPSHSSSSPIVLQLVFSRSLVFFGTALPPAITLFSCASGTFQPTLRTERVAPNLARLVLT